MYFVTFGKFSNITNETANRWEVTNNSRKRPNDAALYLGTQQTVRSISDRFDVQESTFILHNRRLLDVFSDLCKKNL